MVCDNLLRDTELLCHMLNYFFIVKLNAAFLSNLLADKATATAKLSAYVIILKLMMKPPSL